MLTPTTPFGSNHCPDEKGTERIIKTLKIPFDIAVATIAPMKRGLKVSPLKIKELVGDVATIAPMKRGLKAVPNRYDAY